MKRPLQSNRLKRSLSVVILVICELLNRNMNYVRHHHVYEIEAGDYEQMQILRDKADKASIQLRDGFISIKECQMIVKRYQRFENIYNKAQRNDIELYKDMYYIEMADETCQSCHALYRFSDGVIQQDTPHKIGEPLVIKVEP